MNDKDENKNKELSFIVLSTLTVFMFAVIGYALINKLGILLLIMLVLLIIL